MQTSDSSAKDTEAASAAEAASAKPKETSSKGSRTEATADSEANSLQKPDKERLRNCGEGDSPSSKAFPQKGDPAGKRPAGENTVEPGPESSSPAQGAQQPTTSSRS